MSQARHWCFTLNNPDDVQIPKSWEEHAHYCVWQLEVGAEGTPHLQGYLYLAKKKTLGWIKKNLNDKAHWEMTKGKPQQAKDYCTKEDTRAEGPWEYGSLPSGQGERTDLSEAADLIVKGATDCELAEVAPVTYVKYFKGLQALRTALKITDKQRNWPMKIFVFWGPSGSGKSRRVAAEYPGAYWKQYGTPWWCGYMGQDVIVLDDFRSDFMKLTDLQHLMDPNPLRVQTKGGSVEILAHTLVITSNFSPDTWYKTADTGRTIQRRLRDYATVEYMAIQSDIANVQSGGNTNATLDTPTPWALMPEGPGSGLAWDIDSVSD